MCDDTFTPPAAAELFALQATISPLSESSRQTQITHFRVIPSTIDHPFRVILSTTSHPFPINPAIRRLPPSESSRQPPNTRLRAIPSTTDHPFPSHPVIPVNQRSSLSEFPCHPPITRLRVILSTTNCPLPSCLVICRLPLFRAIPIATFLSRNLSITPLRDIP